MSSVTRHRIVIVAAFLFAAGTAFAASPPSSLRYAPAADLTGLDPQINGALATAEYAAMVYDTLFSMDANLVPRPQMVDRETISPDGLRYDFTLRPGLRFHDGQPVTGADVVASITRWMKRDALGQRMASAMVTFQAEGDNGFSMTFRQRFPFVEMALAWSGSGMAAILRKQDAETDPFKQTTTSIGSGPFRFLPDRWQIGSGAAWARNPDYVARDEPPSGMAGGKVARLDGVEMHYIPDASTRANALKTGEIDLVDLLPADLVDFVRADKKLVVDRLSPLGSEAFIRMNQLQPPFDKLKARQALALTVSQPEYMAAAYGAHEWWEEGCFSYFVCGSPNGSEAGSEPYRKPDYERARQLLADSGYKNEPIVIVTASDVPSQNAMAQVTAANLRMLGANVDLQVVEFAQIMVRRENRKPASQGGWNIILLGLNGSLMNSPVTNLVIDSRCEQAGYFGWPCDPALETLRAQYMAEPDPVTRRGIVDALSREAWASLPAILTGMYYNAYAWNSKVTGLIHATQLVFWNAAKAP
jgi:peptide/nickel transport system substrate-binding protein